MNNNDNNKTEHEEQNPDNGKSGRNILFSFISLISFIIIPLFFSVSLLLVLLTCGDFYISIIKKADLVETYIQAKNALLDKKIGDEIEREVHLTKFKNKYESLKNVYEKKLNDYKYLTMEEKYKKLEKQLDELDDLSWDRAPGKFKQKDDFEKYKKEELNNLEKQIDEIKLHRDIYKDEIEKAEDELEDAEDAYETAGDEMRDKIEEAKEIINSHRESFMGEIYSDISILTPVLTDELNNKLIDITVKNEIEKIVSFFSSYYLQKEQGNIYADKLENILSANTDNIRIKFPEISISLKVEDDVNGILQKRHLLSEIFIEKIKGMKNLKNRKRFIKVFKFFDSGLGEMIGRSYLKKMNLSIYDGIIRTKPLEIKGKRAEIIEKIMIGITWGRNVKYILPAIGVLLFIFIVFSAVEKRDRFRSIQRILLYPSLFIIILSIIFILFSGSIFNFFPELVTSSFMQIFLHSILFVITLHLFVPFLILFTPIMLAGFFIRKKAAGIE